MDTRRYWTYSPGMQANRWSEFKAAGVMAIDFNEVGDLRSYSDEESVRSALQVVDGDDASHKNDVRAIFDFRDVMRPGDLVFAKKGLNVIVGVGRVSGDYYYADGEPDMRHRRKVEWFKMQERRIKDKMATKTLTDITPYPDYLVQIAEQYNIEDMYAETLHRVWDEALAKWPIDKLRSMTLPEYNTLGSKNSFCYWLEKRLEDMGSIWGGSAYKFGIFEYDKTNPKPLDSGAAGDDKHRWYAKYGDTAEVAFAAVKSRILRIVEAAAAGDYAAVEEVDFSPAVKWKLAFVYQSKDRPGVVDIYKKEMLMKAVGETDGSVTMAELNASAIAMIPEGMDRFVWARRKWLAGGETPAADSSFGYEAMVALGTALDESGLHYDDDFVRRFVSALCAKPFVVLSGLSGSGKTKLAHAFASWMSVGVSAATPVTRCFTPGLVVRSARSEQKIIDVGDKGVIVAQGNGKCTCLSYEIINEWIETIKKHGYTKDTGSGTIKDQVISEHPKYSPYLHAFDPVLKALAFYQIENGASVGSSGGGAGGSVRNWLLVPVGADWTNSEHLLGYPDALQPGKYVMPDTGVLQLMLDARDNPELPFFLILDEMNLSHVERYFADFLSAMESGEEIKLYDGEQRVADGVEVPKTLKFPKNLYVIGTMNVDETTYMFSPKVLDRAQVIEFRVKADEMSAYLANPTKPDLDSIVGKGAKYARAFLALRGDEPALAVENKVEIVTALNKFFPELARLGAEFGYRTAGEVLRFCAYYLSACGYEGMSDDEDKRECRTDAIDAAIVQKLLPKLHGSQARLGPVLKKLKELASRVVTVNEGDEQRKALKPLYKLTCEKLDRMTERLKANGFTSFAEA